MYNIYMFDQLLQKFYRIKFTNKYKLRCKKVKDMGVIILMIFN
jgi:hypothetical protein